MNKIHSSIAVVTCCTLLYACSREPARAWEGSPYTGFAALADTASVPSLRDSALASLALDSSACYYIEGEFNVPDAMALLYGHYDARLACSKWECPPADRRAFADKRTRSGHLYTRPGGQYVLQEGPNAEILLLTETVSREGSGWESCHACAPILGAAIFKRIDGAWFVKSAKKDIAQIGAWGTLPPSELITIGSRTWGLRFDYDYTAQGASIGGMALLASINGEFKIVADVHTKFSNEEMFLENEGEGLKYQYDSELTWVAGDNTEIHDMYVHTKGRRPVDGMDGNGKIKPFDETRVYTYKVDQYVLYDSTLLAM